MADEVLRIRVLGGFSVEVDGSRVPDDVWRLRRAKTLIKLLALAPDQRLHADEACELIWPGRAPGSARNNLHQALYAARRALDAAGLDGGRCLELKDDLIALCPSDRLEIDAVAFEEAAASAREEAHPAAYRTALRAYEGELLPEDRYEEWTSSRREALRELRVNLGIELAELEAPADQAAAIDALRAVLVEAPLHEPAHRALMRLYAGAGQRQEALAQFQELKRGLRREFEDEPDDETRRLYQDILTRSFEAAPSNGGERADPEQGPAAEPAEPERRGSPVGRIPRRLTSFVGRDRELGEAAALLRGARLLTLTGAGGCGKTRLAFELAEQHMEDFPDGVWPVELAALGEPELIGPAIAQALDTRLASDRAPEIALAGHIGNRRQLLLLDNCEHLVEPVALLVEALLRLCPRLTVLATSREPLRVPGEITWRVPSLSLPSRADSSAERLRAAESVRLFCDRAALAAPGFELSDENAGAVAVLCHRLDGMPLAIELAAARVGALTPAQIAARLDDSLDLLSAGSRTAMTRQQTLRATLTWSFELLGPDEQVLLRRLSVFAGGFSLEAAEDICADDPLPRSEVAAQLGRLAERSLVNVEEGAGEHRYRLLETVRQYAREHLDEAGERASFESRHRDWYVALAERDPTPPGELPEQARLRPLERERDNLRAALASALANDPEIGLRLTVALWRFWLMRGYLAEGYRWLAALLDAAPGRTAVRARALLAASLVGLRRGVPGVDEFATESVAIFGELDDHAEMFDAVEVSAAYQVIAGRQESEQLVREYEALSVEGLPAARPSAWAAHTRGIAAWFRRDHAEARRQLEAALAHVGELGSDARPALWPLCYGMFAIEAEVGYPLFLQEDTVLLARRVGAEEAAAHILVNLAAVDRIEGDLGQALQRIEESLARFRRLADRQGEAFAINALGNLARSSGDFERGEALLDRSLALRSEIGDRRGGGITLGCLGVMLARSGDLPGAHASAEQSRAWFAENDDLIGLGAAELCLTSIALCSGDRGRARSHLEAATSIFGGIESTPQEGWAQAVLAAIYAEDGDASAARHWLDRAVRHFDSLGGEAGLSYCRELERLPGLAAGTVAE
jgi:predicted ATPase/DNA-binding SARP family transcriptional activator